MRLQVTKSYDFNQMLVASVFGHLLFMTFVMFLPATTHQETVIKPAFMVELVEINQGKKAARKPQRPASKKNLKPEIKKSVPVKTETPKAAIPDPSNQILEKLNQLEENPPKKLVQELDQLAKLTPKKPEVKAPILEKTFDELNALKEKKLEPQERAVPPPVQEDPLAQFDNLKMQDVTPEAPETAEPEKQNPSKLQELEFASLSRNTVELEKKESEKSASDLLEELAKLDTSEPVKVEESPNRQPETQVPDSRNREEFGSILQKLDSLNVESKDIKTDTVNPETFAQDFQSDIWKVSTPKQVQVQVVTSSSEAFVQSSVEGDPGADILSLYIGKIHEKVYKNWREPLGEKYNKEVIVSFYIYGKGNIDKPSLKQSSGVEMLDSLAVRAIMESEPFPPFPEDLKYSNLNISIHFKYVPEKK